MFILKFLLITFLIELVISLEVSINDVPLKSVVSFLNTLSKYKSGVKYVKIHANTWKQNRDHDIGDTYHSKNPMPGTRVLIKRLIPHGLPPSKLEYDSKYKTFYRPLVRVHKRKILPKTSTILNIDGNTGVDKYGIDIYDYYDNDENVLKFAVNKGRYAKLRHFRVKEVEESSDLETDEELLQPFTAKNGVVHATSDEVSTQLVLLDYIQKLLGKIRSRSARLKIYQDITKALDKITSLRAHHNSGEVDPMEPGKLENLEGEEGNKGPAKTEAWMPHYPPWNFWTYKKTIYQDECPEGLVKIATLCIWVPPH